MPKRRAIYQREYPLHEVFNALQWIVRTGAQWRWLLRDLPPWPVVYQRSQLYNRTSQSTPESGKRAGYDGTKRRKGTKVHLAVDTLGQLLALCVTATDEQDCCCDLFHNSGSIHFCMTPLHLPPNSLRSYNPSIEERCETKDHITEVNDSRCFFSGASRGSINEMAPV
jgi:transposase